MRIIAAILFIGCAAAVPVAAQGQTTILPPAATLNPREDAAGPRPDALTAKGEVPAVLPGALAQGVDRVRRAESRPPRGRLCFNQAEAREAIAVHRLIDPVRALRTGRQQGDALSAKLCRWPAEEFVYELNILRHDGRILRLFMNARNGEVVGGQSQAGQALSGQALGAQVQPAPAGQGSSPGVRGPDRDR